MAMDLFGGLPEPTSTTPQPPSASSSFDNRSEKEEDEEKTSARKRSYSNGDGDDDGTRNAKKILKELYLLRGYCAERKGEREEMQDAHTIVEDFKAFIQTSHHQRLSLYAVFDGHGGINASKYAAQNLHKIIAQKFPKGEENFEKDVSRCFVESFKKLDEDFLNEARRSRPSWKDGSTVVVVLAVDNILYIANLGDSKAIICRYNEISKKMTALPLTIDHNPTLYEERMRIQKAGGHVRDGRVMGILEVSRSIGDGPFKQHGVSCLPDIKRCQLTDSDRFILIACDGLWKRFEDDSAIKFMNNILEDETIEGTETKDSNYVRMEMACNKLANEALRRLSADNVTILLVSILHPSTNKR